MAKESIPVFITNRNRVTSTRNLVSWLLESGTREITILDNDSTYEPLLDYYQTLPRGVRLMRIGRNGGPWVFWEDKLWQTFTENYVVTDSDCVPSECCPHDLIDRLEFLLNQFPDRGKIGPGLRIDNVPDDYPGKANLIIGQSHYWPPRANVLSHDCFSAPIDTTFALYRAGLPDPGCAPHHGVRTNVPYLVEHVPWYVWPLTEEERYYREHCEGIWSSIALDTKTYGWQ